MPFVNAFRWNFSFPIMLSFGAVAIASISLDSSIDPNVDSNVSTHADGVRRVALFANKSTSRRSSIRIAAPVQAIFECSGDALWRAE